MAPVFSPIFIILSKSTSSLHFATNTNTHTDIHSLYSRLRDQRDFSPFSSSFQSMALQSVSPIPHLLSTKPSSVLSSDKSFLFVDFVGLYCKSKRIRRRIGLPVSRSCYSRLATKNSSSLQAVLDFERTNAPASEKLSSDSKYEVRLSQFFSEIQSSASYLEMLYILVSWILNSNVPIR